MELPSSAWCMLVLISWKVLHLIGVKECQALARTHEYRFFRGGSSASEGGSLSSPISFENLGVLMKHVLYCQLFDKSDDRNVSLE